MSIAVQIATFVAQGTLVPLPRAVRTSPRHIFMSGDVADMVDRAFGDSEDDERYGESRANLENFVRNNRISLRWDPTVDRPANLARVDPVGLCVFDFRSKGQDGGIRVFGAFAKKDWFVALSWQFRSDVNWDDDPPDCRQQWIDLFGEPPPNLGDNPNDYLTSNFHVVRAD